jgi:hypothetical protein
MRISIFAKSIFTLLKEEQIRTLLIIIVQSICLQSRWSKLSQMHLQIK